jgi:hypothetical protein
LGNDAVVTFLPVTTETALPESLVVVDPLLAQTIIETPEVVVSASNLVDENVPQNNSALNLNNSLDDPVPSPIADDSSQQGVQTSSNLSHVSLEVMTPNMISSTQTESSSQSMDIDAGNMNSAGFGHISNDAVVDQTEKSGLADSFQNETILVLSQENVVCDNAQNPLNSSLAEGLQDIFSRISHIVPISEGSITYYPDTPLVSPLAQNVQSSVTFNLTNESEDYLETAVREGRPKTRSDFDSTQAYLEYVMSLNRRMNTKNSVKLGRK